ncbi:CMGC/CDK protein kinase [Allomyces macrogynus ATCC 38327]|uniref:CMGC/CDK protein kinase n=1 Tax=Allomyces macrogynus (strain ATCC 38327) TaxID=578462 RepID=A0A0L0S1C6_ALLM3|nr:CMGC/CDK protein kinase [Allomyces macrogynus ATCC 38327]|eukprot:KNE56210.1 CMGC/CDK protein kinase [Allomyces macrogynus ATCC 38327]
MDRIFPGCSNFADYRLINQVGEGTFGEVHKGESKAGEVVALKRLRIEKETEGFPITAIREIKLLKQLQHPNVVSLVDMAVKQHHRAGAAAEVYMVFPYMEHDLSGLIDNPSVHMDMGQIKSYGKQLFMGLEYLHRRHILHRDLKCANLLINNRGVLKIADFGLARPYDPNSNSKMTSLVVTRWYRPPELLLGAFRYDSAIDLWGAGCILGEMIKRKALFQGNSDTEQLTTIFSVCGSPNDVDWPEWRDYMTKPETVREFPQYPRQLKETLRPFAPDDLMLDLINQLLVLRPENRLTAPGALEHPWFIQPPLPTPPEKIAPIQQDCHEYEVRKAKGEAAAAAAAVAAAAAAEPRGRHPHYHPHPQQQPHYHGGAPLPSRAGHGGQPGIPLPTRPANAPIPVSRGFPSASGINRGVARRRARQ